MKQGLAYRCLCLLFLFLIGASTARASDIVVLQDKINEEQITGKRFDITEDKGARYTIAYLTGSKGRYKFYPNPFEDYILHNANSAVWMRFTLTNKGNEDLWVLELPNQLTDSITLYAFQNDSLIATEYGGNARPFYANSMPYRSPAFTLRIAKGDTLNVYLRFVSKNPIKIRAHIRTYHDFLKNSNREYFFLASFYGLLLGLMLYNAFIAFSVKDPSYGYYVLFSFSLALFASGYDFTGFQFVWFQFPVLNGYIKNVALFFTVISALLYAHSFMQKTVKQLDLDLIFKVVIGLRTVLFLVGQFLYPPLAFIPFFDIIIFLLIYILAFVSYFTGYMPARIFILAFSIFFAGFSVSSLQWIGLIRHSFITSYAIYLGAASLMVLLALALADRIRLLRQEYAAAQKDIIRQLRESQEFKDRVNKMLEEKVTERTAALQEKNRQLDSLIYKASHDIKGPLRSIIGLTTIGQKDVQDPNAKTYFEHILKSTNRLDNVLSDMLDIAKINEKPIQHERIDFEAIIKEIMLSFSNFPGVNDVRIHWDIRETKPFNSDYKIVYSILQNMVENAIKYRDTAKPQSYLNIAIQTDSGQSIWEFDDNGLGIDTQMKEKVFDMFFKANESSTGSGLGLYLVKISVEKLGGQVKLETERGRGSKFTFVF
jgi:signal transduction histidine kinase